MKNQIRKILKESARNAEGLAKALKKRFCQRYHFENDTEDVEFVIDDITVVKHEHHGYIKIFYDISIDVRVNPESEIYDNGIYSFEVGKLKDTLKGHTDSWFSIVLEPVIMPYILDDLEAVMKFAGISLYEYRVTLNSKLAPLD